MNAKQVTFIILVLGAAVLFITAFSYNRETEETIDEVAVLYGGSAHADLESLAFTYWDEEDPPVIPTACARCHSILGLLDYLGEDGSQQGQVDEEAQSSLGVRCIACHNPTAQELDVVVFDSGAEYSREGGTPVCMICHQTRESTPSIEEALAGLEEDMVDADLSFISPHYKFAASTQLGGQAQSGYQYPSAAYLGFFEHAYQAETCTDCHSPHSLQVDPQRCKACHSNVVSVADFSGIREQNADYDGDGDTGDGIQDEILTLQAHLYTAIQAYARDAAGEPVVYEDRHPYFFTESGEEYDAWTPRLIRAAYNYQFVQNDPGGYVHNGRYLIQLLHDSLADLGAYAPVSVEELPRP